MAAGPEKPILVLALPNLPKVRREHLWPMLILGVLGFWIGLIPNSPHDFWWHLKIGELIATNGIPTINKFAWSLPADTPYVYQSWLGEWLFYKLYQLGGLPFVIFSRNLLGLTTFTLVAMEAKRRSNSWRLAAAVVLLTGLMALNNLSIRTQNWSWLPFILTFILFGKYIDGQVTKKWLFLLPLLLIFWVNVHGAFVIGLLVGAAFVLGELGQKLLKLPHALTWNKIQFLILAWFAMLPATLANPLGIGIFSYVKQILTTSAIQKLANEWQPPTPHSVAGGFFYFSVLVIFISLAFARQRLRLSDLILLCGLGWMAFNSARHVIWFSLVAMPLVAQAFAAPRPIFSVQLPPRRIPKRERVSKFLTLFFALLLLLLPVASQPWVKPYLPWPQPYQDLFAPVPNAPFIFTASTPVKATDHLIKEPCEGHLFNEMGYGSYLIWAQKQQIFIDPRLELFPDSLWQDYILLSEGREAERLLQKYDISCVMLDRKQQPYLSTALTTISCWQKTYEDTETEVWRCQN